MKEIVRLDFYFGLRTQITSNILSILGSLGSLEVLRLGLIKGPTEIPGHMFSRSLVTIVLGCRDLVDDPMPVFGELPNLVVLRLRHNIHLKRLHCRAGGFSQLKYLKVIGFHKLKEWKVDNRAMPSLCHVKLLGFLKLKSFPQELMNHNQLQLLELVDMPMLSNADYQKLEQQKFKLHVARGFNQDSRLSDF